MLTMNEYLTIRPLRVEDAKALSAMLLAQPSDYTRFFHAFSFAESDIAKMLAECEKDVYMGMMWGDDVAGFFMLRGWNEGYETPTLGTFVTEKYRGCGFMPLTVELTKIICRMRGVSRVMYKSHPDNAPAKKAVAMGFRHAGVDANTGYLIYHLDL